MRTYKQVNLTLDNITLPSLNVWQRMHWRDRRAFKKQVSLRLLIALGRQRPKALGRRAHVRVSQHRRRLIKDPDNLPSSCKALMDALTKKGLIVDDSFDWIELTIEQHLCGKQAPHVEVAINYLEAGIR